MAHWIGAQDRVQVAKKTQKTPPFVTSPVENPNTKRKNIFLSKLEDFPKPDWVWTTLYLNRLASYGVTKSAKKVAAGGLQG